jgi:hypothetical protein
MPILCSENPSSEELRRCVALLATDFHYDTTRILFESASQYRHPLRDDFFRLRHLAMRWAVARRATMIMERLDKEASALPEWRERETQRFVHALIPSEIPQWGEIKLAVERELPVDEREEVLDEGEIDKAAYLDLHVVTSAHSWLPGLNEALDEAERAEWLSFWREALHYSISLYEECLSRGHSFDSTNDEWYRWLFDRLALVIRTGTVDEKPERLWRPILEIGTEGHHWIETFLSSWFIVNLQIQTFPGTFISQWQKMVEWGYALD